MQSPSDSHVNAVFQVLLPEPLLLLRAAELLPAERGGGRGDLRCEGGKLILLLVLLFVHFLRRQ